MKVSRAQQAENREKIVGSASRLFREKGFEAVTIAEIMADAGLTHGGFYGHFPTKTALMAEALTHGPAVPAGDLKDVAKTYLTPAHREAVGKGCPYAALGGEAARLSTKEREGVTARLKARFDALSGEGDPAKRRWAIAGWSAMVGALLLSRISADEALSDEILTETRRAFGAA